MTDEVEVPGDASMLHYAHALAFHHAACVILIESKRPEVTELPFYWNLSHAVELILKSCALKAGATDLKSPAVRHNLRVLFDRAKAAGYTPEPPGIERVIDSLNTLHDSPYLLRYPNGNELDLIGPPAVVLAIVDRHIKSLAAHMGYDQIRVVNDPSEPKQHGS
jgi:hypothetical protein